MTKKQVKWNTIKDLPSIGLIISIYNEEKVLKKKLENTLSLLYPDTKLQIYLISDCSTDKSNKIIKDFALKEKNIHDFILPKRSGKNEGINYVRDKINEDIVVFSDANSFYNQDSLNRLVEPFSNESIGCVFGDVTFTNINEYNISETENTYWQLEKIIKKYESKIGKVIIGNGAVIAIRRELLQNIPAEIANDLYLPVITRSLGYDVVFNSKAKVLENSSINPLEEYNRKVRIITRGITALFVLFNKIKFSVWLQLLLRKGLRWFVGFALIGLYISNLILINQSLFFLTVFIGQTIFFGLALLYNFNMRFKIGSYAFYYCLINMAGIKGTINKIFGRKIKIWNIPSSTR
jgi:cellulose synthase/poly-beta-1,6-N-acetylglucosamine synthase-like glycosyltransferase